MTPADTKSLPLPKVEPADRLGAVVPAAAETALKGADLANVIVLAHRRGPNAVAAPSVTVKDDDRPAPVWSWRVSTPWTALIAAALLLHLALVVVFMRDPTPMPSLALDSISVEIVLGGQTEAGIAQAPSPAESAPSPASQPPPKSAEQPTEATKPDLRPRIETAESQPEVDKREEPNPEEPKLEEPKPGEPKPEEPKVAAAEAEPVTEAEPEPAPAVVGPAQTQVAVTAEVDPGPKAQEPEDPKPVASQPPPPNEEPTDIPSEQSKPTPPAIAASRSGVGIGSSRNVRDWANRVTAHLARNKRYPVEALVLGIGGTASVTFSVGGDGRVTSVRLVRSSGNASLDRESQDLVRRASPFPPPPQGKASITVPVNFNVRSAR